MPLSCDNERPLVVGWRSVITYLRPFRSVHHPPGGRKASALAAALPRRRGDGRPRSSSASPLGSAAPTRPFFRPARRFRGPPLRAPTFRPLFVSTLKLHEPARWVRRRAGATASSTSWHEAEMLASGRATADDAGAGAAGRAGTARPASENEVSGRRDGASTSWHEAARHSRHAACWRHASASSGRSNGRAAAGRVATWRSARHAGAATARCCAGPAFRAARTWRPTPRGPAAAHRRDAACARRPRPARYGRTAPFDDGRASVRTPSRGSSQGDAWDRPSERAAQRPGRRPTRRPTRRSTQRATRRSGSAARRPGRRAAAQRLPAFARHAGTVPARARPTGTRHATAAVWPAFFVASRPRRPAHRAPRRSAGL